MTADAQPKHKLLTPGEVAKAFRVDPKTVSKWAKTGKIGCVRLPSGHRRYWENEVQALLRGEAPEEAPKEI